MSATIPSVEDIESLHQKLDDVLASYLELLDVYADGQKRIQEHFSSGFLSLAQANMRSTVGRRYGSDWYDHRTNATTRISFGSDTELLRSTGSSMLPAMSAVKIPHYMPTAISPADGVKPRQPTQQPTPPATPRDEKVPEEFDAGSVEEPTPPERKLQKDPLFWFGLLPPSHLRRAQASFIAAVEGRSVAGRSSPTRDLEMTKEDADIQPPIATATNAARGMRMLEVEIRKLRKAIRQSERTAQAPRMQTAD